MDMNIHRMNENLGEAILQAAPPIFGRALKWDDVEEVVKLLNETSMNPHRVISKGQAIQLNHQLTARLGMANKRINELSAMLEANVLTIDAEGTMRCRVSPETVLPVLEKFTEELRGVVAANAKAAATQAEVSAVLETVVEGAQKDALEVWPNSYEPGNESQSK